jgi:hypothetical protein
MYFYHILFISMNIYGIDCQEKKAQAKRGVWTVRTYSAAQLSLKKNRPPPHCMDSIDANSFVLLSPPRFTCELECGMEVELKCNKIVSTSFVN